MGWIEQQKLSASDAAASDEFGFSVAIDDDTAIVGAKFDVNPNGDEAGAAYIYTRSGDVWTEQQKLLASDGAADDHFGASVSVSGDTCIVGAPDDDNANGNGAGAAYVFKRSGGVWTEEQKLLASDGAADDAFGTSVAVNVDSCIIGAPEDDNVGGAGAGGAYVFTRSGAVWTEQQKLLASDGAAGDLFGFVVSLDEDTVAIGAPDDDNAGGSGAGGAYIFTRSAGVWTEQQKLLASDGGGNDAFGYSISVNNDTVVVGAPWFDGVASNSGAAYVFTRSGGIWTEQQQLTADDAAGTDYFSIAVALDDDSIVVGADLEDNVNGVNAGSAYLFTRTLGVWTQQKKLLASDGDDADNFGFAVGISDDTVVIGAHNYNEPHINAGITYVWFYVIPTPPTLISGPASVYDNYDFLGSIPLTWVTADNIGPVTVDSLIIDGRSVIVSDVVQTGFTGTITANAHNGVSVSILPDSMYFLGEFSWTIVFSDAAGDTTTETGTITGPSVPLTGQILTSADIVPVSVEEETYLSKPHSRTKNLLEGWKWDKTIWTGDIRHLSKLPSIYDPLFSGISEDYWQAGIGGGEDLELIQFFQTFMSGIADSFALHNWLPFIRHGHFFLGPGRDYLFSDDSIYEQFHFNEVLSGIGWSPHSGVNFIELSNKRPKPGVPIYGRQYRWNNELQKYELYLDVRHKAFFTGRRDSDNARLSTYDLDKNAILFYNLEDKDDQLYEMISYFSGSYQDRNLYLVSNRQVSQQVGEYQVGSGEFLGYAAGDDDEIFHTEYSPVDSSLPLQVNTYLGNSGIFQTWEVVSGFNTILSGYQVGVDFDLGLLRFPGASGIKPAEGNSVEVSYFKTAGIEYEPEEGDLNILCQDADISPMHRFGQGGFLFLTDEAYEPASITLYVDNLPAYSEDIYGPLSIGNVLAKLVAEVSDRNGQPLEGVPITVSMTLATNPGTLGNAGNNEAIVTSNSEGKATAFYRSPSSINEIGEYITAAGTIDGSPSYDGVTETTSFQTTQFSFVGSEEDFFLFKVWTDDPILGYRDPTVAEDTETQLAKYYEDFFSEEQIYGPTGLKLSGGVSDYAVEWETSYRQIWELLRPVLYASAQGKKILVVKEDDDSLDPHLFNSPAIAPFHPIDIVTTGDTERSLVFDTSSYILPSPGSGLFAAYFVTAPVEVEFQASVFSQTVQQYIYSNKVKIRLEVPPHLNGTWLLDDLNEVDLSEISSVLAGKDSSDVLNKRVVFGFRLQSSNITLAAALGGITFLDVNSSLSSNKWPSLGHKFTISGIAE